MKFATFAAGPDAGDGAAFQRWFRESYAPAFARSATGLVAATLRTVREPPVGEAPPIRTDGDPALLPYAVLLESWFVTTEDFCRTARLAEPLLREEAARFVSYRVTPLLELDPRFAEAGPGGARPELTYITPVTWLPGVTRAEARRQWDEHVPTALRVHAGLSKYERNWVEEVVSWSEGVEPFGAYADFSFPEEADFARFFPDEGARIEITQDISSFIGGATGLFFGDALPIDA